VPAAIGADVDVAHGGQARFVLGWPIQLPLIGEWEEGLPPPLQVHRLVIAPELTYGPEGASPSQFGFQLRGGYRVVFHPGRHTLFAEDRPWGILAGVGMAAEFAPQIRGPALSPEVGLHFGRALLFVTLVVRSDIYFDHDAPVRTSALLGWSFL
jgi:hypothetical protein